jgi:hypothetical protein
LGYVFQVWLWFELWGGIFVICSELHNRWFGGSLTSKSLNYVFGTLKWEMSAKGFLGPKTVFL